MCVYVIPRNELARTSTFSSSQSVGHSSTTSSMASKKGDTVVGAGLQTFARKTDRNDTAVRVKKRSESKTPSALVSVIASGRAVKCYGTSSQQDVSAQVLGEPVPVSSKMYVINMDQRITIPLPREGVTPQLTIMLKISTANAGDICEVPIFVGKYKKGTKSLREKLRFGDSSPSSSDPVLPSRWYEGKIICRIIMPGERVAGSSKVVPESGQTSCITIHLKRIEQGASRKESPEDTARRAKRAAAQRRQVSMALVAIFLFLGVGAAFYPQIEGWTVLEAFWFSIVTITTVGKCSR